MTNIIHKELASGRWRKFSLLEQMGNIGSEVGRSFSAKRSDDIDRMSSAVDRALELFDLTIQDPKNRMRLKEICRAKEIFCGFFFNGPTYGYSPEVFENYFMTFAMAARMRQLQK